MSFYSFSKKQRKEKVATIKATILDGIKKKQLNALTTYFSDEDTYIRKAGYQAIGKIHHDDPALEK